MPAGFSGDYNDLTHLPDLNQYATNAHLNDTLGHYYTNTEINDTLGHYLMAELAIARESFTTLFTLSRISGLLTNSL